MNMTGCLKCGKATEIKKATRAGYGVPRLGGTRHCGLGWLFISDYRTILRTGQGTVQLGNNINIPSPVRSTAVKKTKRWSRVASSRKMAGEPPGRESGGQPAPCR